MQKYFRTHRFRFNRIEPPKIAVETRRKPIGQCCLPQAAVDNAATRKSSLFLPLASSMFIRKIASNVRSERRGSSRLPQKVDFVSD